MPAATSTIGINDFSKVDLRVARVVERALVDRLGQAAAAQSRPGQRSRQVFSGIRSSYAPEQLVGGRSIAVANLEPRKMRFGVSAGMVLCASGVRRRRYSCSAPTVARSRA